MRIDRVVRSNNRADSSSSRDWMRLEMVPGVRPSSVPTADRFWTAATRAKIRISWMSIPAPHTATPNCGPPSGGAGGRCPCDSVFRLLLCVAANRLAAKGRSFKQESSQAGRGPAPGVAPAASQVLRRWKRKAFSHARQALGMAAGPLEALQQALEVFKFDQRPRGLAQAPAQ